MSTKRERRTFSDEFKNQIVQLFNAGKSKSDICREYELAPALVDRWIKRINTTGSAKECDRLDISSRSFSEYLRLNSLTT